MAVTFRLARWVVSLRRSQHANQFAIVTSPHATADSHMSLIFTLALRNLFQDRLRFIASLMGIVFSVLLVMVQIGLYFGFSDMITTMIDHTTTDLWIVSSGTKYFEDLSLLNIGMRDRLLEI